MRKYELQDSHLGGFDLVINVRAEMVKADFKQLQEAFSRVMGRFRDFVGKQVG